MNYSCLYDSYMSLSESLSLKTSIQMKVSCLINWKRNVLMPAGRLAKKPGTYILQKWYSTAFYNYTKNEDMDKLVAFGVPLNSILEKIKLIGNSDV